MKTKLAAAAASAIVFFNVIAAIDDSNVVSVVARKAVELIQKAVAFAFGAA